MRWILSFFLYSTLFARAVIFDFGGVICDANRNQVRDFVAATLHLEREEANRIFKALHEWPGEMEPFWERYAQEHSLTLPQDFCERFFQVILDSFYEIPGTIPLIEELKQRGHQVGLLSNVSERAASFVRARGYYDYFDPCLLSYELNCEKPEECIYELLLQELQLPAEEVIFIDDLAENVEVAKRLGLDAIHFKSGPDLKRALQKRGLLDEERVDLGTHSLWVDSLGKRGDPAILMITGVNCHAHFWTDELAIQLASAGFFVIRYDQRDVGLSTPYPTFYELDDLADDAAALLNEYGFEQAHVVGHSMGGYIAQLLAARYPKLVESLCVVGAGPAGATPETEKPLSAEEMKILNRTFDLIFAHRPTMDFAESLPEFIAVWEHTNGDYPLDLKMVTRYVHEVYFRTHNPLVSAKHHVAAMENMMHSLPQRRAIFDKLTMPVLVVHGGCDPLVLPERGGLALYKALPHAELKLFPKMGHVLFNRDLEREFGEALKQFYRSCSRDT